MHRDGGVADINDLQTAGIISDESGVESAERVMPVHSQLVSRVAVSEGFVCADINDLQAAAVISDKGGVAIGRE